VAGLTAAATGRKPPELAAKFDLVQEGALLIPKEVSIVQGSEVVVRHRISVRQTLEAVRQKV